MKHEETSRKISLTAYGVRKLWLFDAVCRTGGIGQAAVEVGLSQPAVSAAMNKLEQDFGTTLLNRSQQGIELTPQGDMLHRRVVRQIRQIDQAIAILLCSTNISPSIGTIRRQLKDVQIRCHLAITDNGSAAAASRALGVSQPAVHRAARELEQIVRISLYERRVHSVSVNPVGLEFARRIRLANSEIEQAIEEINLSLGGKAGRVAVGILPLVPQPLMAQVIRDLLASHPEALVQLYEASYKELITALRGGKIDLIVGALPTPRLREDVIETELFDDPQMVVVRKTHDLARVREVTKTDLANYDWIGPPPNMPRRLIIENMFASLPLRPRLVVETSSLSIILAILAESDCITLLPRSHIHHKVHSNELVTLTIPAFENNRVVGFTTRADWLATPIQSSFIAQLYKICRRYSHVNETTGGEAAASAR